MSDADAPLNTQIARLSQDEEDAEIRSVLQALPQTLVESFPGLGHVVKAVAAANNRRQMERLASGIAELGGRLDASVTSLSANHRASTRRLEDLFEQWSDRIQREPREGKRQRLVQFMEQSMLDPVTDENFSERMDFLETLDGLSDAEAGVLGRLGHENPPRNISALAKSNTREEEMMLSVVQRLRGNGLVLQPPNSDRTESRLSPLSLTSFGREFVAFCLNHPLTD